MDEFSDCENIENNVVKDVKNSEKRDGNFFMKILKAEKSRILQLAEKAELDLKNLPIDVSLVLLCVFFTYRRSYFNIFY